jgi:hypothetical protein
LSKWRFPKSENLAHEGLLYVLENLEANEWKRVRAWQGLGKVQKLAAYYARPLRQRPLGQGMIWSCENWAALTVGERVQEV